MPYPPSHRVGVKRKIIDSARKLFNRYGFESVSVNQVMAGAGLTHGGFYTYFQSKSDLYSEVLGCFFTDPNWKSKWEGVHVDLASAELLAWVGWWRGLHRAGHYLDTGEIPGWEANLRAAARKVGLDVDTLEIRRPKTCTITDTAGRNH